MGIGEILLRVAKSWQIFITQVRPRRLLWEDPGVKAPLWFGRRPDSSFHVLANILRILCAIGVALVYVGFPISSETMRHFAKQILWGIEWGRTPDAALLESPASLVPENGKIKTSSKGQYAVTGNKPKWLLEVEFRGTEIVSWKQVAYEWEKLRNNHKKPKGSRADQDLQWRIANHGYTAISYAMASAAELFFESGGRLDPQPETKQGGQRKYSLQNRRNISRALLEEYARARKTFDGGKDGIELVWLDEFCLSDLRIKDNDEETKKQRDTEVGQLADIFRGAKRVVVFCHIEDCHHMDTECPWVNRLFTLGEILHAPEVLRMTRLEDEVTQRLVSRITVIPGHQFRSDMQTCAEEDKKWHLHNIMQHATNSGAVTWQSAIHSLVVEAIRRDEADGFDSHKYLGKALNGLLPRRSQLEDLRGINGWADLAWLLELNQGHYNAALLAAVCKLADNNVTDYRWWGNPIVPREGSERLEPLVTAIPAKCHTFGDRPSEPILSIIGPKSLRLSHWPERDSAALFTHDDMWGVRWCTYITSSILTIVGVTIGAATSKVVTGIVTTWAGFLTLNFMCLLAGTIYLKKDTWVIFEDHMYRDHDPVQWLRSRDPTYAYTCEWGPRQLIPEWDSPHATPSPPGSPPIPYTATLFDLRTGVYTRVAITSKPNGMIVLAVHGSGITCMLLDRDTKLYLNKSTTAVKVGMANLPPFVLAQAEDSGTVYVGGGISKESSNVPEATYHKTSTTRNDVEKFGGSSKLQ